MQVVSKYPDGVFSWVDLGTTDLAGAKGFYGGLFGWDAFDIPMPESSPYTMFQLNGYNVAGMGELQKEMQEQGIPPHWSSYINHSDVDAVAAKISAAGGTVLFPPMDVFESGRMIMAMDSGGAAFGVWQPNQHIGAQLVNIPNTLTWNELQTRELASAKDFYTKVFDWTYQVDENNYVAVSAEDRVQAGMMAIDESWGPVPNNWSTYFLVSDVDAAAAKVSELGGTVMVPVTDAGQVGRFAVIQDPQGAVFTIIEYKSEASPPPGY